MFQIIFNELSAAEMSALPKKLQLDLLAEFQILPEDLDHLDARHFGVIEREGKKAIPISGQRLSNLFREDAPKESRFIAFCIRTHFAIFFSEAGCRCRKTSNSGKHASFGN